MWARFSEIVENCAQTEQTWNQKYPLVLMWSLEPKMSKLSNLSCFELNESRAHVLYSFQIQSWLLKNNLNPDAMMLFNPSFRDNNFDNEPLFCFFFLFHLLLNLAFGELWLHQHTIFKRYCLTLNHNNFL